MGARRMLLVLALSAYAVEAEAGPLRVMTTGLGGGQVRSGEPSPNIDCRNNAGPCDFAYPAAAAVTMTATADTGSTIGAWEGDCALGAGILTCAMPPSATGRAVRVRFDLITRPAPLPASLDPIALNTYFLSIAPANLALDSPADFVAALPDDYRQNWLLMSRSESLQPGVVGAPRILLPSNDATKTFTIALDTHSSYPGAHPNAIEYMQWDPAQKNFRFHEIVVGPIPALGCTDASSPPRPVPCGSAGASAALYPARTRGISVDDARCPKCHSTRNVPNLDRSVFPAVLGNARGTDGIRPTVVPWKNKPNWDAYDSWGGLMPFNRDRIYEGTVEAAAFRAFFNLWTWRSLPSFRAVLEQLELQPPLVPARDRITRTVGGPDDGHVNFAFDNELVRIEPDPATLPSTPPDVLTTNLDVRYRFDRQRNPAAGSPVIQGGEFLTLHHAVTPSLEEGRAVQYFDLLTGFDGSLNQTRIADEINTMEFATGSVVYDPRLLALAIGKRCVVRTAATGDPPGSVLASSLNAGALAFFTVRHGGNNLDQVYGDTLERSRTLPRRKADIQRFTLDRTNDPYLDVTAPQTGLIQAHGAATLPAPGTSVTLERLRQEIFRRPLVDPAETFPGDSSEIEGDYVDREQYSYNTEFVALYRYFLEPLGVSVDKWSMGVRGRSRTYTFADVFSHPNYTNARTTQIENSFATRPYGTLTTFDCASLLTAINVQFGTLPPATDPPRFTDIQRIWNKGCIECHGGLGYPPFTRFADLRYLDLSEDETATVDRLERSHRYTNGLITPSPSTARIRSLINRSLENCDYSGIGGFGMMPCGGPKLSYADLATFDRWLPGRLTNTWGDPHLTTVDGTSYDFQAAGEYTLLRGTELEVQTRQSPVATEAPLGPDGHTGLTSCVSINTAIALRVGPHRIALQPRAGGEPSPDGLTLYLDGKEVQRPGAAGIALSGGGRILPTAAAGGLQVEYPGGTTIVITPGFWEYYRVWYLDVDARHVRATEGLMGKIAPGNWLPAFPDETWLGARPTPLDQRYEQLYGRFAKAWHVTDATSLFVYAPGTSTSSFDRDGWPRLEPKDCRVPPSKLDPQPLPPPPMLTPDAARRACAGITDAKRRGYCEQDVAVTGNAGFAKSYLAGERIAANVPPEPPALTTPADDQVDMPTTVEFAWRPTTDRNGDTLTYHHCVWRVDNTQTFAQCLTLPKPGRPLGGHRDHFLAVLLVLLLLLLLLFVRARRSKRWFAMVALLIAILAVLVLYLGRARPPTPMARAVPGLQAGTAYYWKVIAQDDKGGTTESETRRIAIR